MIWVIIPVYKYDHISALCHDLLREDIARILIVDNGDKWREDRDRANSGIDVISPKWNLGWLKGCNFGLEWASRRAIEHDGYLLLNDDTRLSQGFVAGLLAASQGPPHELRERLVGPMYDDVWPQQKCKYQGPAEKYVPKSLDHTVNFVDGTAMYIPKSIFNKVGYLDEYKFAGFGWGADFDYCLRTRSHKHKIIATERSYMNHLRASTAKILNPNYESQAGVELNTGMHEKYGPAWRESLGI